jgi:hypothetical protein
MRTPLREHAACCRPFVLPRPDARGKRWLAVAGHRMSVKLVHSLIRDAPKAQTCMRQSSARCSGGSPARGAVPATIPKEALHNPARPRCSGPGPFPRVQPNGDGCRPHCARSVAKLGQPGAVTSAGWSPVPFISLGPAAAPPPEEGQMLHGSQVVQEGARLGLCPLCENDEACTLREHPGMDVRECEEFDGRPADPPSWRSSSGTTHSLPSPGLLQGPLGLCRICDLLRGCTYPKPESGVWQCEECR